MSTAMRTATQTLLVELFVEELPPKALSKLGEAFANGLLHSLQSQGLTSSDTQLRSYASPRRLAAQITGVPAQAPARQLQQKLMPVSVALDAQGQATPALLKKLQALGLDSTVLPQLRRAQDGKAETLFHDHTQPGISLRDGLQQALQESIVKLPIPKVMSYQLEQGCELPGWSSVSFVRPAHGLIALHGSDIVEIEALGLQAGRTTQGHRFEARQATIDIAHADDYAQRLREDGAVIASFAERRDEITRQLQAAAQAIGGGVKVIEDAALLDEVTALVERPTVMVCQFDQVFLNVPQECLILTMKANQKYFPLLDAQGKLSHHFLLVSNINPADRSAVIGGNERVVRPRLADARFFFDQDRKKTLESRVAGLDKVVYHNKLGTQAARMQRVCSIAAAIAGSIDATPDATPNATLVAQVTQAARLAKTDLLTDMVGEFPELQGIMGGYYARHDGLPEAVAVAIEDHYKPRFAGDALPRNRVALAVALADKLETLVGMFGIGNLPSGDKDPFALRRHALGVGRMLVESDLPLQILPLIDRGIEAFAPGLLSLPAEKIRDELSQFLLDRLRGYFRDQGYAVQNIEAALAAGTLQHWADIPHRLAALKVFAGLAEAPALAAANKRIGNILKKAELAASGSHQHIDTRLLQETAEQQLHAAMQTALPQADAQFAAGDYTAALQTLAALRAPVDSFFNDVMVNADDVAVRNNRLALLHVLHQSMNRVADLSRLAA